MDESKNSNSNTLVEALVTSANETLSKKVIQDKTKRIADEILEVMEKRQQAMPKSGTEYSSTETLTADRQPKFEWINSKWEEI